MAATQRYLALDVFRGITIATMITVNNPGSWSHLPATPSRGMEWLYANRPGVPVLPLYCWRFNVLFILKI